MSESGLAGVAELFDRYWRQGFIAEARDLLQQTAGVASHEPWWEARHALVERTRDVVVKAQVPDVPSVVAKVHAASPSMPRPVTAAASADAASAEGGGATLKAAASEAARPAPMPEEAFWAPIHAELGRLAAPLDTVRANGPGATLAPAWVIDAAHGVRVDGRELPASFVVALEEACRRANGQAGDDDKAARRAVWELVSALWGGAPDGACADLLERLALTRADVGFWGLYLDALIDAGRSRKALVEVQRSLAATPQLAWAKTAYRRLPRIWAALGTRGFAWCEDDGVKALRDKLDVRPTPTLSALVAGLFGR